MIGGEGAHRGHLYIRHPSDSRGVLGECIVDLPRVDLVSYVLVLLTWGVLLGMIALGLGLVAGGLLLHRLRRRRRRLARIGVDAASRWSSAGFAWLIVQPWTPVHWWRAQFVHRRMWQAVKSATEAVRYARAQDAPVGNLEPLCEELTVIARQADTSLRIAATDASGRWGWRLPGSIGDVMRVAAGIHDCAAAAVDHDLKSQAGVLASQTTLEGEALQAGWRTLTGSGS